MCSIIMQGNNPPAENINASSLKIPEFDFSNNPLTLTIE